MNKELILKYKAEFDHFLEHGSDSILVKYVNPSDALKGYEDWHEYEEVFESNLDYLIVINDQYVKFRKALAEGKPIQYKSITTFSDEWYDIAFGLSSSRDFGSGYTYRIKPEEPKFKVGDWVRETKIPEHIKHLKQEDLNAFNGVEGYTNLGKSWEPWKPKEGEWVVFYDKGKTKSATIKRYSYYNQNRHTCVNGMMFDKVEPFIGTLPTNLKDTNE